MPERTGRSEDSRKAAARRLVTLRFVDAFAFAFAWIAVGLWAARTGGAAGFAAVTAAIYLSYPTAVLAVGPIVARCGPRRTLVTSAVLSGGILAATFLALAAGASSPLLLTLVATQSLAGSMASELVKHAAARQNVDGALPQIMAAYRTGFGAGGLAAGMIIGNAADSIIAAAGIAAALTSTAALLGATTAEPGGRIPQPARHIREWLAGSLQGTSPLIALSATVAPAVAVAPGLIAGAYGPAAAGAIAAAVAAGALLGPALRRQLERRPRTYPAAAVAGALLTAGMVDLRAAIIAIPLAGILYDTIVVRQEETVHTLYPDEPGALAVPGLIWSAGVGAAAIPVALAIETYGAPAFAAAAAVAVGAVHATAARRSRA